MLDHSHRDDHLLVVRDAERHFGELTAFEPVSFGVAAGNCCAIVGENPFMGDLAAAVAVGVGNRPGAPLR
ncbi:hypothetical protein SAMN05444580_104242 [Rhodococcus tukisamuensis]|uniref:Uncharacterized protein n=1 Tax=Rhodococcus tukisamuensis TaxID=168276 RepID=A0A1G6UMP9_9NOCA|nr:hypothetical protein SAMN05444580_104242 [Rhodococcus tukisamuensis]